MEGFDFKKIFAKGLGETLEIIFATLGGAATGTIFHFFRTEDRGGKRVPVGLDAEKLREHAPHHAKTIEEVAAFNGIVLDLDPALQKSLEIWMARLGDHQRGDLIIKTATISKNATDGGRDRALKNLEVIAAITPDVYKTRRAVAFKLMKAHESEYLGAQISEQASAAILDAITEFWKGKKEWDRWAKKTAGLIDADADRIERARLRCERVRNRRGVRGAWNRFNQSRQRLSAFPWE